MGPMVENVFAGQHRPSCRPGIAWRRDSTDVFAQTAGLTRLWELSDGSARDTAWGSLRLRDRCGDLLAYVLVLPSSIRVSFEVRGKWKARGQSLDSPSASKFAILRNAA